MLLISQVQKRSKLTGGSENDIPAVSPVAAVGPPSRNVFLPSEANATITAIPGFNKYFNLIDKHKFSDKSSLMGLGGFACPCTFGRPASAGRRGTGQSEAMQTMNDLKLKFEIEPVQAGSGTG